MRRRRPTAFPSKRIPYRILPAAGRHRRLVSFWAEARPILAARRARFREQSRPATDSPITHERVGISGWRVGQSGRNIHRSTASLGPALRIDKPQLRSRGVGRTQRFEWVRRPRWAVPASSSLARSHLHTPSHASQHDSVPRRKGGLQWPLVGRAVLRSSNCWW